MRLVKLIGPGMLIAAIAMFATHANAQTLGEYATTTAAVSSGAGSAGTSIGSAVGNVSDDAGGGSSTWGASSLGESFEERAGSASGLGGGASFDARAGAQASDGQSRWPGSEISDSNATNQFGDSSGGSGGSDSRFGTSDRFTERASLSDSENRFPGTGFSDTGGGLDTTYSRSGLDSSGSTAGLDSSGSTSGLEISPSAISGNN